ncbi:hypothetical protein ACRALDRAFT_209728 [Sodiomyces alcalophilus JCM 7366]|uniref:uncharacterized protein n=1 Tax=Sodiomyces alcalophilus JCM 7366 TaxID=591952 RepID=UPI0039B40271
MAYCMQLPWNQRKPAARTKYVVLAPFVQISPFGQVCRMSLGERLVCATGGAILPHETGDVHNFPPFQLVSGCFSRHSHVVPTQTLNIRIRARYNDCPPLFVNSHHINRSRGSISRSQQLYFMVLFIHFHQFFSSPFLLSFHFFILFFGLWKWGPHLLQVIAHNLVRMIGCFRNASGGKRCPAIGQPANYIPMATFQPRIASYRICTRDLLCQCCRTNAGFFCLGMQRTDLLRTILTKQPAQNGTERRDLRISNPSGKMRHMVCVTYGYLQRTLDVLGNHRRGTTREFVWEEAWTEPDSYISLSLCHDTETGTLESMEPKVGPLLATFNMI